MKRLESIMYNCKYTAGSYADALMSIPISAAEIVSRTADRLYKNTGLESPKCLSWDGIKERSPVYRARDKLRDSLDTRAGAVFLQGNLISSIPFLLAGMPAAELAQYGIEKYLTNTPEVIKYAADSLATLTSQMLTAYVTFMVNEIRTNKEKYVDENRHLRIGKVWGGFKKAVNAFLAFDVSYSLTKIAGQSYLLSKGEAPWKSSALFDSIAEPLFYAMCIPLGLYTGIIETKETKNKKSKVKIDNQQQIA